MPEVLALITKRVDVTRRHLIRPDATLRELGLNPVDALSIACDLEEEILGREMPDHVVGSWLTVSDIAASVAAHT